jgi:Xaa-Pro aminopeptidase
MWRDISSRMSASRRIGLLRRRMSSASLLGLLVTHLPDVRYLSGFTGSSGALAVTRRAVRLFTDGRYTVQAAEEVAGSGVRVEIVPSAPAVAAVQWMAAQPGVEAVGFDPVHTTVAELDRLRAGLPSKLRRKLLVALEAPLVEALRWLKDDDELAIMAEAAQLGCDLFEHMLGFIRPGLTETAVAAELEYQARVRGAEGMSFESIVVAGPRSALPHGRATSAKLPRHGLLTLDFGVILKGYCSDMTRTVCLGKPTAREREVYEAVLEAEVAGVAAVIAGATCGDVDEAARSVLRRVGMAEAFSHSTGHGVGIEIHEAPRVGAGQKTKLAPGMVITIEPGAYFAGEFGVRIEDMVVVTRTGGRVLTGSPKALIQL